MFSTEWTHLVGKSRHLLLHHVSLLLSPLSFLMTLFVPNLLNYWETKKMTTRRNDFKGKSHFPEI